MLHAKVSLAEHYTVFILWTTVWFVYCRTCQKDWLVHLHTKPIEGNAKENKVRSPAHKPTSQNTKTKTLGL